MDNRSCVRPVKPIVIALLLALVLDAACLCQETKRGQSHPKSLITLPFGSDVEYRDVNGRTQLVYRTEVDYPAESALKTISKTLGRDQWKPLKWDFWNPSIPSSHVRGWQQFDDLTTKPTTRVSQWMAQWENPEHDVVSYTLEYRFPVDGSPNFHSLRVIAIFIPGHIAAKEPKAPSK